MSDIDGDRLKLTQIERAAAAERNETRALEPGLELWPPVAWLGQRALQLALLWLTARALALCAPGRWVARGTVHTGGSFSQLRTSA